MNRDIIKANKKEFDYWLENGKNSILVKAILGWTPLDIDSNWNLEGYEIVINDKLVAYRKALVEGKKVYTKSGSWACDSSDRYTSISEDDLNINIVYYIEGITDLVFEAVDSFGYRVKPKEPKFKVGDKIINAENKKVYIFNESDLKTIISNPENYKYDVKWAPTEDEYCWFSNDEVEPFIARFAEMSGNSEIYYNDKYPIGFKYCEPIIYNFNK